MVYCNYKEKFVLWERWIDKQKPPYWGLFYLMSIIIMKN